MHVGPCRTHFRVHVDSYIVPFLLLPTTYITWPLIAVVYCLMLHFVICTEPTIDDGGFFPSWIDSGGTYQNVNYY